MTESATPVAGEPVGRYASTIAAVRAIIRERTALRTAMERIATDAVSVIDGADGVGVTLSADGTMVLTAASAPFVVEVDTVQYGLDEGPCVTAVERAQTLSTGCLGVGEARWPRFAELAAPIGVRSVASFPLLVDLTVVGSLNVYAYARDAFGPTAIGQGERFAGTAAVIMSRAALVATTRLLTVQLEQAITDRAMIESAVGVLMFRGGIGADDARHHLRQVADLQNRSLASVASTLVADAVLWSNPSPTDE